MENNEIGILYIIYPISLRYLHRVNIDKNKFLYINIIYVIKIMKS